MDTFLAIASKRDVRQYTDAPIAAEIGERILDAGRLSGSAVNRQPWEFRVIEDATLRGGIADAVYAPGNVRTAAFVVAIVGRGKGPVAFDCGRAAQNMMLAAWNEGVGSCPNGMPDRAATADVLGLREGEEPAIVLTFGYPERPRREPESQSAEAWVEAADRKPFEEVVERL
jgi:nitroreductase